MKFNFQDRFKLDSLFLDNFILHPIDLQKFTFFFIIATMNLVISLKWSFGIRNKANKAHKAIANVAKKQNIKIHQK